VIKKTWESSKLSLFVVKWHCCPGKPAGFVCWSKSKDIEEKSIRPIFSCCFTTEISFHEECSKLWYVLATAETSHTIQCCHVLFRYSLQWFLQIVLPAEWRISPSHAIDRTWSLPSITVVWSDALLMWGTWFHYYHVLSWHLQISGMQRAMLPDIFWFKYQNNVDIRVVPNLLTVALQKFK